MAHKLIQPHDRFIRRVLADLDVAQAFFRRFLLKDLGAALDLEALCDAKETYLGADLEEVITDLLFTAPFRDSKSFISLLVEHKSEGAARAGNQHILPFQMRQLEMKIMDHGWRNHKKKLYPRVHLLGLYHGKQPYSGPLAVSEKMTSADPWMPGRWSEKINLIDLASYDDMDLLEDGKLGVFLLVLKHIYDQDMLNTLEMLIPYMQKVEELQNGADFLVTVFRYLYEASKIENKSDIDEIAVQSFTKETGEHVMTIAEQIEAKKAEKIALKLFDEGLDITTIVRCTDLSTDEVTKLSQRRRHS